MSQINRETQPSVLSSVGPACAFDGSGLGFTEDCSDFNAILNGKIFWESSAYVKGKWEFSVLVQRSPK